eukprot:7376822-Prymnesium_polylepis.1
MVVAVFGTRKNVATQMSGRARCRPAATTARFRRGSPVARLAFKCSMPSSNTTHAIVTKRSSAIGQREMSSIRSRYEPKHSVGMKKLETISNGVLKRFIQRISITSGAATSKTIGTATTHWKRPTSALSLNGIPASLHRRRNLLSRLTIARRALDERTCKPVETLPPSENLSPITAARARAASTLNTAANAVRTSPQSRQRRSSGSK